MPRKVLKKEKETSRFLRVMAVAIAIIGVLILIATAVTWQPYDISSLATRVNLLTLSLGVLYVLFAYVLFKVKL